MANLKVAYCGGKWVENDNTIEWSSPKKNNVSNITSNWDTALSGGIKNETDADAFIFAETEGENRLVELHVFKSACPTKMTCEYTTPHGQIIYNNTNIWRKELYNSNGILVNTVMADYDSFSGTSIHKDLRIGTYGPNSYRAFASPSKVKFSFINIDDDIPSATNENMFSGITSLKSCDIPWQMKNISTKTFYGCTGLTDYSNAEWIETIGESAFTNCIRLQTIKIGWPTSISPCSFYGCSNATTIDWCNLPSGKKSKMTKIPNSAFTNCTNLQYSKFSDGQTSEFTIPNGITEIGEYAFYNCTSLTNINLNQATKIGKHAFDSVGGEQEVTYDGDLSGLTSIDNYAFENVNFTSGVTINCEIGEGAFYGATIGGTTTIKNHIGVSAFAGATINGDAVISGMSRNISTEAFYNATITGNLYTYVLLLSQDQSFKKATINGNVTIDGSQRPNNSVPSQAFIDAKIGGSLTVSGSVGTSAFEGVQISGDVTVYGDVNEKAFYGAKIGGNIMVSGSAGTSSFESAIIGGNIITVSGSVGTSAFTNAVFQASVPAPPSITIATSNSDSIDLYAFANSSMSTAYINTNALDILDYSFSGETIGIEYFNVIGEYCVMPTSNAFSDNAWPTVVKLLSFSEVNPSPTSWVMCYKNSNWADHSIIQNSNDRAIEFP